MDYTPTLRHRSFTTNFLTRFSFCFFFLSSSVFAQENQQNSNPTASALLRPIRMGHGSIRQTTALFPTSRAQLPHVARPAPLVEQASSGFAVMPPLPLKEAGPVRSKRLFLGVGESDEIVSLRPVCGPAPDRNSFACFNLESGESLADIPLPGQLSTTPQYFGGSWYVGTTRGFFIRYEATGVYLTPGFGIDSSVFHGPDARLAMKSLSSVTNPSMTASATALSTPRFRGAWLWFANANAEFIGTPQFGGGRVFVLTANQSLNAYEIDSGKLLWGVRLAPEVQLRLSSTSLVLHERGLVVGTSDGQVMLLDPKNGQTLWRQAISGAGGDRFSTVAAPVLALSDGIVASNAESSTQRLSWDARTPNWTYGVGSVVQSKLDEGRVYIAGSDGALHKLDARTGQLNWRTPLPGVSPLVGLSLLKKQGIALAANAHGGLYAIHLESGRLLAEADSFNYGPISGDFFAGRAELGEVCLSYRTPGFACWTWDKALGLARHDR